MKLLAYATNHYLFNILFSYYMFTCRDIVCLVLL